MSTTTGTDNASTLAARADTYARGQTCVIGLTTNYDDVIHEIRECERLPPTQEAVYIEAARARIEAVLSEQISEIERPDTVDLYVLDGDLYMVFDNEPAYAMHIPDTDSPSRFLDDAKAALSGAWRPYAVAEVTWGAFGPEVHCDGRRLVDLSEPYEDGDLHHVARVDVSGVKTYAGIGGFSTLPYLAGLPTLEARP